MRESPQRLAIVVSHPTQYYSPWFRALAATSEVSIKVFYLWDFGVKPTIDPRFGREITWDVDLLSGYESTFVRNVAKHPGAESFFGFRNPDLARALSEWSPDALLLFGYAWASHLRALVWARLHGVPILFRGDSHMIGRSADRGASSFLKRLIFAQFAAITYVGAANRDYFRALGVPESKLSFAPHSVNAELFREDSPSDRARALELRAGLGIPSHAKVILFAGKLVAAKQPMELLEAFIGAADPNAALLFVGDGELKRGLEARARASGLATIHFLAFANQSEMPSRYLAADIFVLPSRGVYETWGLAVNEAMHCGTPCLVSSHVGCQRDLVSDGLTGWVFEAEDDAGLKATMQRALADVRAAQSLAALKARIRERIAGYTYDKTCEGVLSAFRAVTGRKA